MDCLLGTRGRDCAPDGLSRTVAQTLERRQWFLKVASQSDLGPATVNAADIAALVYVFHQTILL